MSIESQSTDPSMDDEKRTDWLYIVALIIIAILGIIFSVFYVRPGDFNGLGTIAGVALASMMTGGLIGFLFGVPRRLQDGATPPPPANPEDEAERSLYAGNTNLEQISDWLTKIIVGVSLVELGSISTFIRDMGHSVALSMGMADTPAFPTAAIVLYIVCGFMIGYLWARLYLPKALNDSERSRRRLLRKIDALTKQNQADVKAMDLVRAQLADQAQRPTLDALKAAILGASTETRAYIFYLSENLRWKNWRDKKITMERTIPVFQALVASDTDSAYHRNFGQLGYALKDQRNPDFVEAEKMFTKAIEIRGSATDNDWHAYEANRAVCRVNIDPGFKANPRVAADPTTVAAVMADLRVGAQDPWSYEWLTKDLSVSAWLGLNQQLMPPPSSPTP